MSCFAAGCKAFVPSSKVGCLKHWNMLPGSMRDEIWAAFRAGDRARTLELARSALWLVETVTK